MDTGMNLNELPPPEPAAVGRKKLVVLAALALLVVGGAAFWLTGDEESKKELAGKTGEVLENAGLTPLIDAGRKLLNPAPPPPPQHTVGTAQPGESAAGTLVQGTMPSPADVAAAASSSVAAERETANEQGAPTGRPEEGMPGIAPVQREDTVIRTDFLRDFADWMVTRYKAAPSSGRRQLGSVVQAANLRYGVQLRGMEARRKGDVPTARADILRYAFNPAMLEALYGIYAGRLVDYIAQEALAPDRGKPMSEAQLDELYKNYAAFFRELSRIVANAAGADDLKERLERMHAAGRQNTTLHTEITKIVFAVDEAREKEDTAALQLLEARLSDMNARYRLGLQTYNSAHSALVYAVRKGAPAGHLDDESVLFVTLWLERRMESQADGRAAALKGSALLANLADRFEEAAGKSAPAMRP